MRRSLYPWIWSATGLAIVLATAASVAWAAARHGDNIGDITLSILSSTFADDVIPRLLIGAAFVWGLYLLVRSGPRRDVLAAAAACTIIGILASLYVVVRAELGFAQAFPNGGAAGGWAPGEARAVFLPVSYLNASVQAALGLLFSTLLLTISALSGRSRA